MYNILRHKTVKLPETSTANPTTKNICNTHRYCTVVDQVEDSTHQRTESKNATAFLPTAGPTPAWRNSIDKDVKKKSAHIREHHTSHHIAYHRSKTDTSEHKTGFLRASAKLVIRRRHGTRKTRAPHVTDFMKREKS